MSYDENARRQTPLATKLKAQIRNKGPMTVADYMRACLHDSKHGYYHTQPAIGSGGDFITAPEISQVFGELIGLWSAVVWQQMGQPDRLNLIELGPGRGTLMRDALRAAALVPDFHKALNVKLIESNATLQRTQQDTLGQQTVPISRGDELQTDGEAATIIVANEFLDTFPVQQFVCGSDNDWRQRYIGLSDDGELMFLGPKHTPDSSMSNHTPADLSIDGTPGKFFERQSFDAVHQMLHAANDHPLAALFFDYGHLHSAAGETLQAVRDHTSEHPLTSPGEADLTAHVDFEAFGRGVATAELAIDGPMTQGEFLGALGIVERASKLMANNPNKAAGIEAGIARLMAPQGMGGRFKAVGVRSSSLPPLPGFPV